jgi:hypothetical protein
MSILPAYAWLRRALFSACNPDAWLQPKEYTKMQLNYSFQNQAYLPSVCDDNSL